MKYNLSYGPTAFSLQKLSLSELHRTIPKPVDGDVEVDFG